MSRDVLTCPIKGTLQSKDQLVCRMVSVLNSSRSKLSTKPSNPEIIFLYSFCQMWNSVGIVRGYNDDQDNAIDVEFHDTAVHHAMHLTNSLGHTVADLSQEAVLLACPGTDELAR